MEPNARRRIQLGIRSKLFLLSFVLIAVALAGAAAFVSRTLARDLEARARAGLLADVDTIAVAVRHGEAFTTERADGLLRELARASQTRLTLIDPGGRVLVDTAVARERVGEMENHARRPEVASARATGFGIGQRESNTLHESLLYVARRVYSPRGEPWVLRAAAPPRLLAAARDAARRQTVLGALFGLATAALLSYLAAQLTSRPVRELTATARAMLSDLSVRSRARATDEIGALAGALDELAAGLATSLSNLEHERDQLEAILEAMVEGVLVTDAEGRIVLANRALRETLLVGKNVVGQTPIEAIRNADLHELIAEAQRTSEPVSREVAVSGVRPRRVLVRAAPLGSDGAGVVAVLSDVTELRRLETVRRDFVANVSHELRTPIAAVRGAVETLKDGALGEPAIASEFVSIIDRHGERLHQLVEDLLELSRIEAKELKITLERVPVGEAVAQVTELLKIAASKRNTRVATDIAKGADAVLADRKALGHVLSNLVDNAIKYSPDGASVTVRVRVRDEATVRIAVEDTGFGIEARHLPRVFERFYRVDAGRSRQLGGTGLGLAIVKHLAEAMGGAVGVESQIGRGSTFYVDLPKA